MKKVLSLLLALVLLFSLAACKPKTDTPAPSTSDTQTTDSSTASTASKPVAEEVKGVTIPAFSVVLNGVELTQDSMAAYPVYSVQAVSINSAGTESTVTYVGFAVKDLLDAAGLKEDYVWIEAAADDGYKASFSDKELISSDTTLLAVTKDGSPFDTSPWFAPCSDTTTGNYIKGCVSILVNTSEGSPSGLEHGTPSGDSGGEDAAPLGELPEILDRTEKVEFSAFSFLVNGVEVTNETLEGLSIYKIDATAVNSKGESSVSGYTGYKLADVLEACGITDAAKVVAVANDGYENEISGELITSDYTLIAIEKDKELGEDGTVWLAPCSETENKSYSKLVVEIKAE